MALVAGSITGVASAAPPADGPRALAWGEGYAGGLGTGNTTRQLAPAAVTGGANTLNTWGTSWFSLDGGTNSACGVGSDDSAYCWGLNNKGQLGGGTNVPNSSMPVRVLGGPTTWASVSAGDLFSCGMGGDASAYCWGLNSYGQLGDGTNVPNRNVPVQVSGGPTTWASVRTGTYSACGVGSDDSAYCWGLNDYGQLGDGSVSTSNVPVLVVGGPTTWASVNVGHLHACGVGGDGKAYCWGKNDSGQLGNGSSDGSPHPTPVLVQDGANTSSTWKSVVTNYNGTCGIGGDDSAYCWGSDNEGQLGNGSGSSGSSTLFKAPVRVSMPAGVKVRMLAADGEAFHFCALSTDDTAYCWGGNWEGQLGNNDNSRAASNVPVLVQLGADFSPGTPRMIAVGMTSSFMVSRFGTPTAPTFTNAAPPTTGTVATAYSSYTFTASGTTPITFTKVTGTLPPGLKLSASGGLSGTPTTAGSYTFTVQAANGTSPNATTPPITIVISNPPNPPAPSNPPALVPASQVLSGQAGVAVAPTAALKLVNFTLPARFSVYPALPQGLTLDPVTGVVSGTPVAEYPSTRHWITATAGGGSETASSTLQVSVAANPTPSPSPTPTPTPTPVPVPSDLTPGDSLLLVDGVPVPVQVDPKPSENGLTVTGDGWAMDLDGLGPDGKPLNLGPDGVLILQSERDVQTSGSGFQSESLVDLYVDPPVVAPKISVSSSWVSRMVVRASNGTYVGTVKVDATGAFDGVATLPADIAPGDHVLQAVGFSSSGQTRALNLGVRIDPSLLLNKGTRMPAGMHDRINTTGTSTGIDAGVKLTPYIKYSGQSVFSQGKATIVVKTDGTFTWTRLIKKGRAVTAYVAYTDITSNEVVWLKLR